MKKYLWILLTPLVILSCGPAGKAGSDKKLDPKYQGLLINEVAAHDELDEVGSWVEILNPTSETKSLDGLGLFLSDAYFSGQTVATLSGTLAAGERKILSTDDGTLVTGFASDQPFTLVLGSDKDTAADSFVRKEGDASLGLFASWQRIPDGSGDWRKLTYPSPGRENTVFSIDETRSNAVWVWGSHMSDLLADDAAKLQNLKTLGYDNILLNAAAFDNRNYALTVRRFMQTADALGLTVHAWIQCFYNGGWINPIDDENNRYKEEEFERIRENARGYIENYGVKGVHLDYIRFGGTAYKHNPSAEVNAVGAVNRCCREIREVCDSFDEGLVTSAALMPEVNSTSYYAQDPAQMGQWIHILMPMIYRYGSYNFSDAAFQSTANWFADQAAKAGAVEWAGIQTYDAATQGMTAEKIRRDIDLMRDTRSKGIVLFRYQLGTFPDVTDIDWQ